MCSLTLSVEICREPLHDGILSIRDQMSSDFLMTCGVCSCLNGVRYSVRLESLMNLLWLTGSFLRQGNEQWSFQRALLVPLTLESTGSSETRLPQTLMWTEQPRFDFGRVSWLQFGASLQVSASSDAFRQPACRTTLVFVARTFWERCWEFCWADWQSFCRSPCSAFASARAT